MKFVSPRILKLTFVVYLLNYLGASLNYLFHFVSGNRLNLSHLGEFESLFSFFSLAVILIGGLNYSLIEYFSHHQTNCVPLILRQQFLRCSLILILPLSLLYWPIASILRITQPLGYFLISVSLSLVFFTTIFTAFLQTKYHLVSLTLIGLFSSITRTLLLPLTNSPYLALFLSTFFGLIIAIIVSSYFSRNQSSDFPKYEFNLSTLSAVTTTFFLNLIITQDIFLVKHYFSADAAGIYSAASIIGKVILFASTPIISLAIPLFIQNVSNNARFKKIFLFCLIITILIGGTITLIFSSNFSLLLRYMFRGHNFALTAPIAPSYFLQILTYTLFNLIIQFLICLKSRASIYATTLVVVIQFALITFFHQNLQMVVGCSTFSLIFGLFSTVPTLVKALSTPHSTD